MGVRESRRVLIRKLQLSRSRNRCVEVHSSTLANCNLPNLARYGCLEVPEVKRAKEVTYKKQFSILWYVDIQLLTISRGEVFVIPFGRNWWHDVTENVSRDLIPDNNLQSIKFEFIPSAKEIKDYRHKPLFSMPASGSWTLPGTSEPQNALLNAWTKFEQSSWCQFRSFVFFLT